VAYPWISGIFSSPSLSTDKVVIDLISILGAFLFAPDLGASSSLKLNFACDKIFYAGNI